MDLKRWLIVGAVALVVLVVGGPFFYTHVIESKAPKKLSLSSDTRSSSNAGGAVAVAVDGAWKVTSGSQAGYRVKEVLFGQSHEAVGRTSGIAGDVTTEDHGVMELLLHFSHA